MNPYMMPLPYYGGPPGGMQGMQMNPQMDPRMLQYLQQQQHMPLTPDQIWPFQHPGSGAPDLPQDKKKQQQQQQQKGDLSQVGMNMLYPGGGTGGFPYGISPQMWGNAGKGIANAWGQS